MLKDLRKDLKQEWMRFGECITTDDDTIHDSWCCSEDGKTECGEKVGTAVEPRICRSRFVADKQRTCQTPVAEPRSCDSKTDRLVFTSENWNVPQKIYVDAIDDEEYETKGHDFDIKLCHVAKGAKADCSSDSDALVIKGVLHDNEADSTTELEDIIDTILGEV